MRGDSVWMGFGMLSCRASNSGDCDDIITGARIKITPQNQNYTGGEIRAFKLQLCVSV